jgi:hypothetical protein
MQCSRLFLVYCFLGIGIILSIIIGRSFRLILRENRRWVNSLNFSEQETDFGLLGLRECLHFYHICV